MKTTKKYGMDMHLARFATDQMCYDYLVQVRWNGRPTCPKCGNDKMNYYINSRKVYKCSSCKKQFSLTKGTIFERSKLPLKTWFLAIYIFTTKKRGVSSYQMARWLGVKQHTAWYVLQRLRKALENENDIVLSGIVEADETSCMPKVRRDTRLQARKFIHEAEQKKLHGPTRDQRLRLGIKLKRGRKKGTTKEVVEKMRMERDGARYRSKKPSEHVPFEQGCVIFGMIERGGRLVMKKLGTDSRSVTAKNVTNYLRVHINPDSTLITDENTVYFDTDKLFAEHLTVNHQVGYVVNGIHNNSIENAWGHIKRMISGTYFHISYRHFNGYIGENTYRWNRKDESLQVQFESFIPLISGKRITYKEMIKKEDKLAA